MVGEMRIDNGSSVIAFNGDVLSCRGLCSIKFQVNGRLVEVVAIVSETILPGIDVILGMDGVGQLGGVTVDEEGVTFLGEKSVVSVSCSPQHHGEECIIDDQDFFARFDGEKWVASWKWKGERPTLLNKVSSYSKNLTGHKKDEFNREVERWISEGILVPWEGSAEYGIVPLFAVEQPTKNKIRPVLDYRELNKYIQCHTGDEVIDVCSDTLREWRGVSDEAALVDLKSAYLQVHIAKELWKYQIVSYDNKLYCLTRLGFGLSSAPRMMSKILKTVLSKSQLIGEATSSYIDDVFVDTSKVSPEEVVDWLRKYGLIAKAPESLDGSSALGLRLRKNKRGELMFSRGNDVPRSCESLSRRELFAVCGKLVGHYPVAGWLRVACSYVKRVAEGVRWDDYIGDQALKMVNEMLKNVECEDPVSGRWYVPKGSKGILWCDASNIALGAVLEVDGYAVEDTAWLRKRDDFTHINVAELEAVLKGINLALKWGIRELELMTDSATVCSWISSVVSEDKRIRTKGAAELIIKRRIGILRDLLNEFSIELRVTHVSSQKNKADVLTRVKSTWLKADEKINSDGVCSLSLSEVRTLHNTHHCGVERSLYLAKKVDQGVSREQVRKVVQSCQECQSIDPAPCVHLPGAIHVSNNWARLAIDVTHYHGLNYLTMVDCGPGRLAIWRHIRHENVEEVLKVLREVFLERGPVGEVLMDNSTVFRSEQLRVFFEDWRVNIFFRAAYRPGGNGIVERNHRTVKAMAERGRITPEEAVFWYNMSPRQGQDAASVPHRSIFNYEWRHPLVQPEGGNSDVGSSDTGKIKVGDEVWVKPGHVRCTERWKKGTVTGINSRNNVSVNGVPRHILDVREVVTADDEDSGSEVVVAEDGDDFDGVEVVDVQGAIRKSSRKKCAPVWMGDYVGGGEEF